MKTVLSYVLTAILVIMVVTAVGNVLGMLVHAAVVNVASLIAK
jgi:hypothetical protein